MSHLVPLSEFNHSLLTGGYDSNWTKDKGKPALNQPVSTGENFCNASPLDIEAVYRIRAGSRSPGDTKSLI